MGDPALHLDILSGVRTEFGYTYVWGSHWVLVQLGGCAAS